MVICMAYFGISLALSGIGGSLIMSFALAATAELVANMLSGVLIAHIGRHNTMAAGGLRHS